MSKQRLANNYDFTLLENLMYKVQSDHSSSTLNKIRMELDKFFLSAKCKGVLYTTNTDKLFFGMRVYPEISGDQAIKVLEGESLAVNSYYIEFDSKLFDPMLNLKKQELVAIMLHEIGHIVYDQSNIDEIKKHIDMYYVNSGESPSLAPSKGFKELLSYALKDAVVKYASIFTKFGNEELVADAFVTGCGYGPYLESGFRKILRSGTYLNKDVDDRFIVLSWVLRVNKDIRGKRLPAIKTLNKAKLLSASELEKREIAFAISKLNMLDDPLTEGSISDVFKKKISNFKVRGIHSIKNDIYELNLRLRASESESDLLYIIRVANSNIAILQDYLTEPDISEEERQSVCDTLQELYSIRQKAAKEQNIRDKYSSMIQVVYPNM